MRATLLALGLLLGTGMAGAIQPPITSRAQTAWESILIDMGGTVTNCVLPNTNRSCAEVDSNFSVVQRYIRVHRTDFKQVTPWKQVGSTPNDGSYAGNFQVAGNLYLLVAYSPKSTTYFEFSRIK